MSVMDLFKLNGKVAIITGGHAWLGYDMACALAEAGCHIVITSRELEKAQHTAQKIAEKYGNDTLALEMDQRFHEQVVLMAKKAFEWKGHIDILINNAGGGSGKSKITPVYVDMEHTPDIPTGLPTQFDDMYQAEWAIEAVNSLFERGIIHGKTPSQFCPNDHITREEFTKLIIEYLGIGDVEEDFEINFHDVRKQDWHYEYIKKAVGAKIIRGFSDTEFGSGRYITRQDIAVIIYNAILYMEKALDNVESDYTFSDMYDVSEYAQEAVAILKALNILNGYEDNTFRPLNFATRAEAAKIIYSLDNIL